MRVISAEPVSSFFASRAAAEISAPPPVSQMSVLRELSHSAISVSRGPSSVQCSCHIKIREGRKPPLNPPQHINPPESCSGTILTSACSEFIRASDSSAWRRRGERPRLV